jgi:hypothetical protein
MGDTPKRLSTSVTVTAPVSRRRSRIAARLAIASTQPIKATTTDRCQVVIAPEPALDLFGYGRLSSKVERDVGHFDHNAS